MIIEVFIAGIPANTELLIPGTLFVIYYHLKINSEVRSIFGIIIMAICKLYFSFYICVSISGALSSWVIPEFAAQLFGIIITVSANKGHSPNKAKSHL